METLQQKDYHYEGKNWLPAKIHTLAAYQHIADGFFRWACGGCGWIHSDRTCGWPINGQVLKCDSCLRANLLVCTNTDLVNELLKKHWACEEHKKELENLRGIKERNEQQLRDWKSSMLKVLSDALAAVAIDDVRD